MITNKVVDNLLRPAAITSGFAFPAGVTAAPYIRSYAAASAYEARVSQRISGTAVLPDFYGVGIGVSDPEQIGPMILEGKFGLRGSVVSMPSGNGLVFDRQAAAPLGAGVNLSYAASNDLATLPIDLNVAGSTGAWGFFRALVDTRITSATVGVTSREFWFGPCVRLGAGAYDLIFEASLRLYKADPLFFQPGK